MLSKEEALKKVQELSFNTWGMDNEPFVKLKSVNKLIREIYSIKPYKFEDLKVGMWVWDSKEERCSCINSFAGIQQIYFCNYTVLFEENRFYPVQMANVGCE